VVRAAAGRGRRIREEVDKPAFDLVLYGRVTPPAEAAEALAVAAGGGAEGVPAERLEYHDLVGKALRYSNRAQLRRLLANTIRALSDSMS
jgi:hypothetical protein